MGCGDGRATLVIAAVIVAVVIVALVGRRLCGADAQVGADAERAARRVVRGGAFTFCAPDRLAGICADLTLVCAPQTSRGSAGVWGGGRVDRVRPALAWIIERLGEVDHAAAKHSPGSASAAAAAGGGLAALLGGLGRGGAGAGLSGGGRPQTPQELFRPGREDGGEWCVVARPCRSPPPPGCVAHAREPASLRARWAAVRLSINGASEHVDWGLLTCGPRAPWSCTMVVHHGPNMARSGRWEKGTGAVDGEALDATLCLARRRIRATCGCYTREAWAQRL